MARKPKTKLTKKPPSKKPAKPKRRARPTNQNTVRVHVVNTVGGESAPPPYTGPDRGYFAFNPVFDMGTPKQAMPPPMNAGLSIASGPVKRVSEMSAQTDVQPEGIFDRFLGEQNPTVSLGSIPEQRGAPVDVGEGSGRPLGARPLGGPGTPGMEVPEALENMTVQELREVARFQGVKKYSKKKKNQLILAIREAQR